MAPRYLPWLIEWTRNCPLFLLDHVALIPEGTVKCSLLNLLLHSCLMESWESGLLWEMVFRGREFSFFSGWGCHHGKTHWTETQHVSFKLEGRRHRCGQNRLRKPWNLHKCGATLWGSGLAPSPCRKKIFSILSFSCCSPEHTGRWNNYSLWSH